MMELTESELDVLCGELKKMEEEEREQEAEKKKRIGEIQSRLSSVFPRAKKRMNTSPAKRARRRWCPKPKPSSPSPSLSSPTKATERIVFSNEKMALLEKKFMMEQAKQKEEKEMKQIGKQRM